MATPPTLPDSPGEPAWAALLLAAPTPGLKAGAPNPLPELKLAPELGPETLLDAPGPWLKPGNPLTLGKPKREFPGPLTGAELELPNPLKEPELGCADPKCPPNPP